MYFMHSMEKDNHPGSPTLLRPALTTFSAVYALTARAMQNFMWE